MSKNDNRQTKSAKTGGYLLLAVVVLVIILIGKVA